MLFGRSVFTVFLIVAALSLPIIPIEINGQAHAISVRDQNTNTPDLLLAPDDKTADSGEAMARPALTLALALPLATKLPHVEETYLDVLSILSENNDCTRFYGGSAAIEALNELTERLVPSYLDPSIALRMKGRTASARNVRNGFAYRLWEKAELNLNGPFVKSKNLVGQVRVSDVGDYAPNTREARAAILLHEIGHMIQRADGKMVLPDDGTNVNVSQQNTWRVIAVCREQINNLDQVSHLDRLRRAQTAAAVARVRASAAQR